MRDIVGAYAPMVLAEGEYTVIAKNRDKLYQRELKVEAGRNQEVESSPTRPPRPRRSTRRTEKRFRSKR